MSTEQSTREGHSASSRHRALLERRYPLGVDNVGIDLGRSPFLDPTMACAQQRPPMASGA